ncbi:hypothetical protein [Staphylococcus succinus]|uniref:hypothetical protein n=1 Tax=Staphylococcus succinus TaxID=61015 RepID=UPI00301C8056
MKTTLLVGILSTALLLGACGNEEPKEKEETKAKTEHSEKSKESHKKDDSSKEKDKNSKDDSNKENESQESTQSAQNVQEPVQETAQQEPSSQQEPVQESTEPVQKPVQNQPNGDAMFDTPVGHSPVPEEYKDDVVDHSIETEEEVAQAEKETLREKYDGGLSSGEIQTKNAIENGYYDGPNADEVLKEIESEEQKIADGYYK